MRFTPAGLRIVDFVSDTLIALAALVGTLAILNAAPWGLIVILLALAGIAAQLVAGWSARIAYWSPLGRALVLRTLAALAVAIGLAVRPGGSLLVAVLAILVLVGSVAAEPLIARAVRFSIPLAVHVPGLPSRRERRDLGWVAVSCSLVVTAAGAVLVLLGLPTWLWPVLVILSEVPLALAALDGRAKVLMARSQRVLLAKAMTAFAPDFFVYTSRPDDASYQITMWLPYLEQAGLKFAIITRNRVPALALADLTEVPVIEARGIADLETLIVPSLKAAFYVNASSGNGALVRFQHLSHIYLGHGDSDKPPSYNPTHAMYDQIFAAGPAAARRYAAHGVSIPAEKFRIVGRPQVEDIQQVETAIRSVAEPVVLYAPTWRGHVEETMLYSLPQGEQIVSALLQRGARVIFRPHPFSYDFEDDARTIARIHTMLDAASRQTGRAHLWGAAAESDLGIRDCINTSDAMVSDVSSVVSDYLFSGKPFAMIAVPAEPAAFVAEFPVAQASYVVRGDLADLGPRLAEMLGDDPLAGDRRRIRADYLGDFPATNYASAFVDTVRHISGKSMVDISEDRADNEAEGASEEAGQSADEGSSRPLRGRSWSAYARLVLDNGLELLSVALALVAFGVALAGGAAGWVLALAVLSVWAAFQSAGRVAFTWAGSQALVARGDIARAVLATALLVMTYRTHEETAYAAAVALIVLVIVIERRVRVVWGDGSLIRHLPAAQPEIGQWVVPRVILASLVAVVILLGLIVILVSGPPAILVAMAVGLTVLGVAITVRALRTARNGEQAEERLRPALEAYAPQFAVYFSSTVGADYQVGMWLPYFLRIGRPFVIITRTAPMLRQIEALCTEFGVEVPLIHRRTLRSVEEVIVDSMAVSFYVNNAARNTHFVERREITHVWLNHGDSEKPACFNPVHAIYDLIFAAGQAGIDRYERHGVRIPREKFRIVGRPQVERITPARGAISAIDEPTVLYAPTWQGPFADSRVYSLPIGREIVMQALSRGARVIFRVHPFNYRYPEAIDMITEIGALLDADRAATERAHLWGPAAESAMSIEDCFNASDVMVSDVSAVVSDYLHSGKPLAMVSMGRTPEELVVDAPAARAAYVLREDLSNLGQVFDDLLGADPLAPERQQTRVYYLGDFPAEAYAEGFLQAAREVIDAGRNPA